MLFFPIFGTIIVLLVYFNLPVERQEEIKTTIKNTFNEIRTWWAK